MSSRISKLTLDCFRGASGPLEINFDGSKTFTLIFGENGTGKSTIADAIDFVANQSFGSLEDRSLGVPKHPFIATLNHAAKDCKVEVLAGTNKWTATLLKQKVHVVGVPPHLHAMVLRRAQLLKLVEAEPAKRYEALQGFIDVGPIEAAEQELRDAIRNAVSQLEQAVAVVNENEANLNAHWEKEGKPGVSALDWGATQASIQITEIDQQLGQITNTIRAIANVEASRNAVSAATADVQTTAQTRQQIEDKLAALPAAAAELSGVISLLIAAQPLVERQVNDQCPLCEQAIDHAALNTSVASRLNEFKQTADLLKAQKAASDRHQASVLALQKVTDRLGILTRQAALSVQALPKTIGVQPPSSIRNNEALIADAASELPTATVQAISDDLVAIKAALEQVGGALQASKGKIQAVKTCVDRLISNTSHAQSLNHLIQRMRSALQIIEPTRKEFTQGVLDAVSTDASSLYSIMHPGEELGPLKLIMSKAANKKASIDQTAAFGGKDDAIPQAYFSESHLDTLGFCVFLAVAKRNDPKSLVIVLDDVFTSVDSVHLTRIMQLLQTVASDFAQLVVLTHYRTWRDRYRLNQGPGANVQLLELHRWSLPRGVRLSGTLTGVEELTQTLQSVPLNRQGVASQAGILLEAVLDRLSLQYRRRLPRTKENEWALGDLIGGCKKLLGVLKLEEEGTTSSSDVTTEIKPFIDETGPLLFIRNQVGCHFNSVGADVADADVEAFGSATIALVKALCCKQCGDIPQRSDGSHFRCGCKKTKMSPLEYDK